MKIKRKSILIYALIIYAVFITGMLIYQNAKQEKMHNNGSSLLAKRIYLENPSDILINFEPLRQNLRSYLDQTGLKYSIYFEYLFSGTSIKDSNNESLVGASLMKIPLVMDLYRASEDGKINLDQKVTITKEYISDDPEFGNTDNLKAGDKITLRELAKLALTKSDNTAALAIHDATKSSFESGNNTIDSLGIETRVNSSNQGNYAQISAREYSNVFKCLYFSCLLSQENSEEILSYLTQTSNDLGLRSGTPKDTQVAHKIGSFGNLTQSDCGIIYQTNRRYVLCIMIDSDRESASQHIKTVSKTVSDYVRAQ